MEPIDVLMHYGILGQKWGIRRKPKPTPSSDSAKATSLKKKHVSEMTNDELSTVLKRIRLEKEYKELSAAEKKTGAEWVQKMLANSAKEAATTYTKKTMNKVAEDAFAQTFGSKK